MSKEMKIYSGMSADIANRIFSQMYTLTLSVFCLSRDEARFSKGIKQRWLDLADIWKRYSDEACEYSVFDLALHKIYWGIYPENTPTEYIPLLTLVETELLTDGPAYAAWKYHIAYRFAFRYMTEQEKAFKYRGPRVHSRIFRSYQNARFWFAVVYKREVPGLIDPTKASMRDMRAAKTHENVYAVCDGFEKVVLCLIPEAKNWSDEQWLDDLNLRRMLKKKYNLEYKDFDDNFDMLMVALMNKLHYNKPMYLAQILRLTDLPTGVVKQIWPTQTEEELKKLFLKASSRAKCAETKVQNGTSYRQGAYSYEKLRNSWLYKQLYINITNKSALDPLERKVKKALFVVGANIA